jgi:chromosomal replication initiation ATPase DnaA
MTLREKVLDAFLTRWSATPALLFSDSYPGYWGYTRQVAMYLFHEVCDDTFEEIAAMFPGQSPDSVRKAVTELELSRASNRRVETMLAAYYELIDNPHGTRRQARPKAQRSLDEDGEQKHSL